MTQVTSLRIYSEPRQTKGGSKIIASFDLLHHGVLLLGCALVAKAHGGFNVWGPGRSALGNDSKASVRFQEPHARQDILVRALAAFEGMGGDRAAYEAGWTVDDEQEGLPPAVAAMLDRQIGSATNGRA